MNLLHQVISSFDDAVFLLDESGRFIDCFNVHHLPLLRPPEHFLQQNYREVLPVTLATRLEEAITRLAANPSGVERFDYELSIEGVSHWFSCSIKALRAEAADQTQSYAAVIRDISAVVVQRENIRHKEQALIASATANEALLKNRNIVQAAGIGLRELGLAMKVDRCYMFRNAWNEELQEEVSNQLLEWTNDFTTPQINNPELQDVPVSMVQPFMDALLQNRPYVCLVDKLPPGGLHDILDMQGIKSLIALPIWVEDRLWGFVGFDDCTREREWSNADISILASFASSVSSAITRRLIEDDLERAKHEAEQANKAKSMFLSNITHEIRTPLHGVTGYAEMLSGFAFPHPEDEYFNNLKLSANTLYELINNILDFSKIEAGVFEINAENYLLDDILTSAIASVSYLVKSSGNQLQTRIDADSLPRVIHIDATRLKQVLVNLMSNALKFSTDSAVELSVTPVAEGIRFQIRDHGIGISEEHLQRLFTPFTQFDSSLSKKYQGSGLGLSITRHILNLMGSEPEVESVLGKGSTFAFTLPAERIRPRAETPAVAQQPVADLAQAELDVMVVEDNRLNMLLAETVLRDIAPRIRIHKANNGMEAIQLIENGLAPDLVLMDLQMPILDGFETTRIIRELYHAPLRIVALTASAISEVRDRCMSSGMNDFLAKPFTREQISQLLQRQITGV